MTRQGTGNPRNEARNQRERERYSEVSFIFLFYFERKFHLIGFENLDWKHNFLFENYQNQVKKTEIE